MKLANEFFPNKAVLLDETEEQKFFLFPFDLHFSSYVCTDN
jgi:hypothetical protein